MPLLPIERIRLDKAAVDEGFGIKRLDDGEWLAYDSLGAPATIRLTCVGATYFVAVNRLSIARELAARWEKLPDGASPLPPPSFKAFVVQDTAPLHRLVREIWRLARALPAEPLKVFEAKILNLPRTTEIERLVVQRIGQGVFREALMLYWDGRCAVTGLSHARLLRASHIVPWAKCEDDGERLNVMNGLLLAPHLDAAFDAGLISFQDDGAIVISPKLTAADQALLGLSAAMKLATLSVEHVPRLAWHRKNLLVTSEGS